MATLALAALAVGCASSGPPGSAEARREPARLVGAVTRGEIEAVRPEWVEHVVDARPDAGAAAALLEAPPAELTIYLGTWCSDSRRELTRFWRALDDLPVAPPLTIRYVAVDRAKREPRDQVDGVDLLYVPTFIVAREGREIGRIIEEAPVGIEIDLLDLLTGRMAGWVSARDDLEPPTPASHRPDRAVD